MVVVVGAGAGVVVVVVGTWAGPQPQSGATVRATDGLPVVASREL